MRLLAGEGPLGGEDLAARLVAAGLDLGDDAEVYLASVLDPERVVELSDGRLVDVLAVADGAVFSHALSAAEIAEGKVVLHPDLSVLDALASVGLALESWAGPLEHRHDDEGDVCLLGGTAGWMGLTPSAGDVVTIAVGGGATTVTVVPGPLAANAGAVAGLRMAFQRLNDSDDDHEAYPVDLFSLWLEARVATPEAFRQPQAPLGRLIAEAGLEAQGEMVAPAGFDWLKLTALLKIGRVAQRWALDETGGIAWAVVTQGYRMFLGGDLETADADLASLLGDPCKIAHLMSYEGVAEAFMGEILESEPDRDGSVAAFAELLLSAASGRSKAGPLWLRSVCAERNGQTLEAEQLVAQSIAADGSYQLALGDAAWYASDRGDARRAASLLRRAGVDTDDELLAVYDYFARVPRAEVGRNQLCPCGSGRKYKHCHLGKATLPLTERAVFLYHKATEYLERGRHYRRLFDIAAALAGRDDDLDAVGDALEDRLVNDLALFEDGVWGEFLADRGMLLPPDELSLAQRWQSIERSVHEVQAVTPDRTLTTRDLRTGEVVEVLEPPDDPVEVGDLICARILPDGDGHQIFGGLQPVGHDQRDQLLELLATHPDAVALAAWLSPEHRARERSVPF
jgi:hypothetical protein